MGNGFLVYTLFIHSPMVIEPVVEPVETLPRHGGPMKTDKFKTFTASMIAVVTVFSALVAWRAASAASDASDADFLGLVATVNTQEAEVLNAINVSEHFQAFLAYTRYYELGNNLYDAIKANPSNVDELRRQKSASWGIAFGLQSVFFPSRYLRPDGKYDAQRETDELMADARRARDMRASLHFEEGSLLRTKANRLVQVLILLGLSFWFFTLAQILEHKIRILFALIGGFLLGAGILAVLVIGAMA